MCQETCIDLFCMYYCCKEIARKYCMPDCDDDTKENIAVGAIAVSALGGGAGLGYLAFLLAVPKYAVVTAVGSAVVSGVSIAGLGQGTRNLIAARYNLNDGYYPEYDPHSGYNFDPEVP